MHRFAALALATLLLPACSTGVDWGEMRANPREFFNLNPPVIVAGESAAATRITLKQGQALVLRLPQDAAHGAGWRMRPLPRGPVVAPVQQDFTAKPGANPAAAGEVGEVTFRLRGIAPGTQAVTLDYVRSGFTTPERSVAFDVTVR